MALSCPNTISEDRVNKVSFRINRTEHTFFLLCLYLYCDPRHSRGAAIIITIMAKQMQHKALHPFPVISVPHAHGGDSGNHQDPAWKHPPPGQTCCSPYSIHRDHHQEHRRAERWGPQMHQCLAPLVAGPGPKHRRWSPAAPPGATCRSSAQGNSHWAALHFLWGKGSTTGPGLHLHIQILLWLMVNRKLTGTKAWAPIQASTLQHA